MSTVLETFKFRWVLSVKRNRVGHTKFQQLVEDWKVLVSLRQRRSNVRRYLSAEWPTERLCPSARWRAAARRNRPKPLNFNNRQQKQQHHHHNHDDAPYFSPRPTTPLYWSSFGQQRAGRFSQIIHNRFSKTVKQKHRFIANATYFFFYWTRVCVWRAWRFHFENKTHVCSLNHSEDWQRFLKHWIL